MTDRDTPALDDQAFLLSRARPGPRQVRLALGLVALLVAAAVLATPFAAIPLPGSTPFLPAYATAVLVNDLVTCVLLLALFSVTGAAAILALAAGYLFLALTIVPWALTFPGALAPDGLLDAGLQGTAAIAAVRRLGFPLFVIAFAAMQAPAGGPVLARPGRAIVAGVAATTLAVTAMTVFAATADDALPGLMRDRSEVSPHWRYVPHAALVLCAIALALLWRRGRSVLDLWVGVVVCTLVVEVAMLSYVGGGSRLSVGWWAGRAFGLVSASVVLVVLLAETTTLYARLARAVAVERRTREARLTTMEALSAAIAHEVNQPVASMVTNADAGLRWLERARPDLDEARSALRRIVREGHRAGQIVDGIRSIFRKSAVSRKPLDVNRVIGDVLDDLRRDLLLAGAQLETDLAPALPVVRANRLQLEQVLMNLVANALEAMAATEGQRVLRVASTAPAPGQVLVAVADTGIGLPGATAEEIFDPFVTSKPDGLGMGLMLCRSIVEAHGGRLWAEPGVAGGAVFKFSLPAVVGEPGKVRADDG